MSQPAPACSTTLHRTCHSARPSATASRCCHERMIHDLRGWPAGMLESSYSRLTPFSSRPGCRNLPDGWGQQLECGSAAMFESTHNELAPFSSRPSCRSVRADGERTEGGG